MTFKQAEAEFKKQAIEITEEQLKNSSPLSGWWTSCGEPYYKTEQDRDEEFEFYYMENLAKLAGGKKFSYGKLVK